MSEIKISDAELDQLRRSAKAAVNDYRQFGAAHRTAISTALDDLERFEAQSFKRTRMQGGGRIFQSGDWESYSTGMQQHAKKLFGAMAGVGVASGESSSPQHFRRNMSAGTSMPQAITKPLTLTQKVAAEFRRRK